MAEKQREIFVVIRQLMIEADSPPHGYVQMVQRPYGAGQMPTVYTEVDFRPRACKDTGPRRVVRI